MESLHPKVAAGSSVATLSGALAVIVMWLLTLRGVPVTPELSAAFTALFTAAGGFIGGYCAKSPGAPGKD